MKKVLLVVFLILLFMCILTSCNSDEPTQPTISISDDGYVVVNGIKTEYEVNKPDEITISDDGYVIVNGVKTEILVDKDDVITVNKDGYLVVNGIKTKYEINKPDVISITNDGYVVVNGVKTEYLIDKDDVITIEEGYIVVNGIRTEYEVKNQNHSFSDWKLHNEGVVNCEKKLYYRICSECSTIEWKDGRYDDHVWNTVTIEPTCENSGYDTKTCSLCGTVEICNETNIVEHSYSNEYANDNSYHWKECKWCEAITDKKEHTVEYSGSCSICNALVGATEGIIYDISNDGTYAVVAGYSGNATKIRIAEEYNDLPVKEIYAEAFRGKAITTVVIPDSVTCIGEKAFYLCDKLIDIEIGNCVTDIGDSAFSECHDITSIVIPDSVRRIGARAFDGCYDLHSIVMGKGVISIGGSAFDSSWQTRRVYITDISLWCNISFLSDVHSNPLWDSGVLYLNGEKVTNLIIPEDVTSIGFGAFYGCQSITSVSISDNVTSVGQYAFSGIKNLELNEYENCKYLGNESNPYRILITTTTQNLTSYTIHSDTAVIADSAFSNCERITNIYYSKSEDYWQKIKIGSKNNNLTNATIHFNYVLDEE